jgi:hypothetical protein
MAHGRVISRARARARAKQATATAKAQQDVGPESTGEIARLNAYVVELLAEVRRLEIENRSLRSELAKASEGRAI